MGSMPYHISVVIPAFNEAAMLPYCLEALQNQSRLADAIYVVDNNSTDETKKIAERFGVIVIPEPLQGICAATYRGLETAVKHEGLILRCDADCRPQENWIEQVEQLYQNHPGIHVVTGPGVAYDVSRLKANIIDKLYMKPYFFFVRFAVGYTPLFGSNFAITASAWEKAHHGTHLLTHQNIHDDIDISYHVKGTIMYDNSLAMPISARPFKSKRLLVKRYIAGFRTIFIHWPKQAPWKRYNNKN